MRRMTTGVGALESPDVGGPSRYLEHMFLTFRKNFQSLGSQDILHNLRQIDLNFSFIHVTFCLN